MAVFTAPPNQNGLVLDQGDLLLVERQGLATNTVINAGGREDVVHGGVSDHTTINLLGVERVEKFSSSNDTVVHRGGREIVEGVSNHTDIMGGREIVEGSGRANDTTIGNSGRLEILNGAAVAHNVTFADQGENSIELLNPNRLTGTITNWRVGDFVDLLDTKATSVSEHGNVLTVTYEVGREFAPGRLYARGPAAGHPFRPSQRRAWRHGYRARGGGSAATSPRLPVLSATFFRFRRARPTRRLARAFRCASC